VRAACSALIVTTVLCSVAHGSVPAGTPFITSTRLPIRVFYDSPGYATYAQQFLDEAENEWDLQITQAGFAVPLRTDTAQVGSGQAEEGFDAYILQSLPKSVLYTFEVEGDDPSTLQAECPTLALINGSFASYPGLLADAAGHLLNHASLHAVDCLEPALPAFDMVSEAVQFIQARWTSRRPPQGSHPGLPEHSRVALECVRFRGRHGLWVGLLLLHGLSRGAVRKA